MDMTLEISFITLSNIEINFHDWKLNWRSYITTEVLPITKQIKLIRKKMFVISALNLRDEAFVVHITFISSDTNIHLFCRTEIALLKAN